MKSISVAILMFFSATAVFASTARPVAGTYRCSMMEVGSGYQIPRQDMSDLEITDGALWGLWSPKVIFNFGEKQKDETQSIEVSVHEMSNDQDFPGFKETHQTGGGFDVVIPSRITSYYFQNSLFEGAPSGEVKVIVHDGSSYQQAYDLSCIRTE